MLRGNVFLFADVDAKIVELSEPLVAVPPSGFGGLAQDVVGDDGLGVGVAPGSRISAIRIPL